MNEEPERHDKDGQEEPFVMVAGRKVYLKGERLPGTFTTYDEKDGHCGLCGRLTCNGRCFK